jgi:hypothetical protein
MKINVAQPILDLDGKQIDGEATLRKACVQVLLNPLKGDDGQSGQDKASLFALAMQINSEDEPDLAIEDWAKIKERVGRGYGPLVVGRVYAMIDPPAKLKAVEQS